MAKAQFHRHQKVWVESVGCWAAVERIIPIWAKGFDEPVRISYDIGLGREFRADELRAESPSQPVLSSGEGGEWRILRARNKWQAAEDCSHHPQPGTFPVVVTDSADWGGWRVPGAEYDRDPQKVEMQARLVACAPKLLQLAHELALLASDDPEDCPPEVLRLSRVSRTMIRFIRDEPAPAPIAIAAE
jgi:hypothetical protein